MGQKGWGGWEVIDFHQQLPIARVNQGVVRKRLFCEEKHVPLLFLTLDRMGRARVAFIQEIVAIVTIQPKWKRFRKGMVINRRVCVLVGGSCCSPAAGAE